MATSRTRNLRLFLSSGLSTEAKANLEILDRLGGVYQVDNSEAVNIRSKANIRLLPGDPAAGGVGNSNVEIGSQATPVANFVVHANVFELNGSLRLPDYLVPLANRKFLTIRYNSTKSGVADTADRELVIDVQQGNRAIILAQDLELAGSFNTKLNTTAETNVTLPVTGTLATLANVETFTNKTLTSPHITNPTGLVKANVGLSNVDNYSAAQLAALSQTLTNKSISGAANTFSQIPYSALSISGQLKNVDIASDAAIAYTKLDLVNKLKNSDISPTAAIAATKVQVTAFSDNPTATLQATLNTLQIDIDSRTLDTDFDAHTNAVSAHGTSSDIVGISDNQTLTNKVINANNNNIQEIKNSSISTSAAIEYTKLNLLESLRDSDWSEVPAHKLTGAKIAPDFGAQLVETELGLRIGQGFTTTLGIQSQTQNLSFKFPANAGGLNYVLATDGSGNTSWIASSSTGTVSKVGLSAPSILSVTTRDGSGATIPALPGDPTPYITATGYFDIALANQAQNLVFAGPEATTGAPTFRSLITADLPAPLNTDAARNQAISDQVAETLKASTNNAITWSYNPGTRELRPTFTLAPYTTSSLAEGARLYYTDERVATKAKNMIAINNGSVSGVTIAHGSSPDSISFSVNQAAINTDNVTEGSTNVFFTAERAHDAINALLLESTEIAKDYNDLGDSLTLTLKTTGVVSGSYGDATKTVSIAVDSKGRLTSAAEQSIAIPSTQVTDFVEAVQDVVGSNLVGSSSDLAASYVDDPTGALTLSLKPESITSKTEVLPEATDYIMVADTSDANALKKVSLQAVVNLSGANFAATWTAGTTLEVVHNLASRDVLIQLYSLDTFEDILVDSIVRTTENKINLSASEAPTGSGWRVLIRRI